MFGPRIVGDNDIELRPPVLEDYHFFRSSQMQPEVTRFWGPRFTSETPATAEDRLRKDLEGKNSVLWSIAYQSETVGFTGIFIGRHDLYGKGIASEAVRLRMAFIWNEMNFHRAHNWIALANKGSWRANQKSGYSQIGTYPRSWFRSGEWFDEWLGEAFPSTFPSDKLPSPWSDKEHPK